MPATVTKPGLRYEAVQDKLHPEDWRAEYVDIKTGDVMVAIFSGPLAEERAREYAEFKNRS
jgi:hypothetical protein